MIEKQQIVPKLPEFEQGHWEEPMTMRTRCGITSPTKLTAPLTATSTPVMRETRSSSRRRCRSGSTPRQLAYSCHTRVSDWPPMSTGTLICQDLSFTQLVQASGDSPSDDAIPDV